MLIQSVHLKRCHLQTLKNLHYKGKKKEIKSMKHILKRIMVEKEKNEWIRLYYIVHNAKCFKLTILFDIYFGIDKINLS